MIAAKVHKIKIGIEVLVVRRMMCRRVMHRLLKLKWRKNGNGLSNPEGIERCKHVGKGNIVMDLNAFVALPSTKERAIVKHIFG